MWGSDVFCADFYPHVTHCCYHEQTLVTIHRVVYSDSDHFHLWVRLLVKLFSSFWVVKKYLTFFFACLELDLDNSSRYYVKYTMSPSENFGTRGRVCFFSWCCFHGVLGAQTGLELSILSLASKCWNYSVCQHALTDVYFILNRCLEVVFVFLTSITSCHIYLHKWNFIVLYMVYVRFRIPDYFHIKF